MDDRNSFKLGFLAASFLLVTIGVFGEFAKLANRIDKTTCQLNAFSDNVDRELKNLRKFKLPKIKRNYHLMSK